MRDRPRRVERKPSQTDRHKPSRLVRVKELFAPGLERVAALRGTSLAEEVNRAVRELLERESLWPPVQGKAEGRPQG